VPAVELRGRLAALIVGYRLIANDLEDARRWSSSAQDGLKSVSNDRAKHALVTGSDAELARGLFVAALSFYAKCFTRCEGRAARLTRDLLDAPYRPAHKFFMAYRHAFAAHSGREQFEWGKCYLVLHPKRQKRTAPALKVHGSRPTFVAESPDGTPFTKLIEHALQMSSQEERKTASQLAEEAALKGADFWYRAAKAGNPVTW
jgi:hypothetical protein